MIDFHCLHISTQVTKLVQHILIAVSSTERGKKKGKSKNGQVRRIAAVSQMQKTVPLLNARRKKKNQMFIG